MVTEESGHVQNGEGKGIPPELNGMSIREDGQLSIAQSREELEQLKNRLEAELSRIQEAFFRSSEEDLAGELASIDQHPADTATVTEDRELSLTVSRMLSGRREEVLRALEKIREGTYGTCDIGGEPINPERMKARPEAIYCLDHQRMVEQRRAQPRGSTSSQGRRT